MVTVSILTKALTFAVLTNDHFNHGEEILVAISQLPFLSVITLSTVLPTNMLQDGNIFELVLEAKFPS